MLFRSAEIDVFLELSCFFHDPADVGNLISANLLYAGHYLSTLHTLAPLKPSTDMGGRPYCFYPPFSSRGAQERLVTSLAQVTQVVTRGARILAQAIWVPHIPPRSPCCWGSVYTSSEYTCIYDIYIRFTCILFYSI